MCRFVLIAVILSHILCSPVASAQNKLTQLDFDTDAVPSPVATPVEKELLKEILEEEAPKAADQPIKKQAGSTSAASKKATETKQAATKQAAAKAAEVKAAEAKADPKLATAKGATAVKITDWVKPEDPAVQFIVPIFSGPQTDPDKPSVITTVQSWKRDSGTCQEVSNPEQLCNKAKALKELFERFSGGDEFYFAQCENQCDAPDTRSILSGFAVRNLAGAEFQVIEEKKVCRYRMAQRGTPPIWQVLRGERGSCACLPASCLVVAAE